MSFEAREKVVELRLQGKRPYFILPRTGRQISQFWTVDPKMEFPGARIVRKLPVRIMRRDLKGERKIVPVEVEELDDLLATGDRIKIYGFANSAEPDTYSGSSDF